MNGAPFSSFQLSFVHLFDKYLSRTLYVPDIVPGAGGRVVNDISPTSVFKELTSPFSILGCVALRKVHDWCQPIDSCSVRRSAWELRAVR